jgi:hypothetical protein
MCGWVREETRPGTLVFLPAGCADGRGDDGVVCLVAWCHRRRIAGTGRNTGFVVIILAWALEDDVCFAGGGHGVRVDAIDPAAWQAFVELDPQEARDGEAGHVTSNAATDFFNCGLHMFLPKQQLDH